MMELPVGVVLAGGQSRRMGRDKAAVELAGRSMAAHVLGVLSAELRDVVVIGRTETLEGHDSFPDIFPGHLGPLAGLATALARFRRPILLVAVDQPLLRPETVRQLLSIGEPTDTVLPVDDDVLQVTCGRYSPHFADVAIAGAEQGNSLIQTLRDQPLIRVLPDEWQRWGEDGRSWYSMDSMDAIAAAEQRFRVPLLD